MLVNTYPFFKNLALQSVLNSSKSNFSVSCSLQAGKIWRQKHGLPKLQTAKGTLIDSPDYSFTDGRPAPLSVGQAKRKELQKRLVVIFNFVFLYSNVKILSPMGDKTKNQAKQLIAHPLV